VSSLSGAVGPATAPGGPSPAPSRSTSTLAPPPQRVVGSDLLSGHTPPPVFTPGGDVRYSPQQSGDARKPSPYQQKSRNEQMGPSPSKASPLEPLMVMGPTGALARSPGVSHSVSSHDSSSHEPGSMEHAAKSNQQPPAQVVSPA